MIDSIFGLIQSFFWFFAVLIVLVVGYVFYRSRYKSVTGSQALVITGGRKGLQILPQGGRYVSPLRKHAIFPLGMMTVRSNDQETQTSTLVPVVVQWTAQIKADVETPGALEKAVQGYSGAEESEISQSLQQTLDGEVRAVVATMTPEQVVRDKDSFSAQVTEGVQKRMEELGFKLISLNITEVTDKNGHYQNLAAEDRENRRKEAETLTAEANKDVAVQRAKADEIAQNADLARDLAIAEKNREVSLRKAEIKAQTDQAEADAAIARELQTELRNQELEARRGEVRVIEEQQRQKAAAARREVEITDAETAKQKLEIEAAANARQSEIEAEAKARVALQVAKGQADAAAAVAQGQAEAEASRAKGEADATNLRAEANANATRREGLAEAEVAKAKGEAEAAAILAKGEAEAAAQHKMAEALAANDAVNLKIRLAEIQRDTTIEVSTAVGQVMARIGENATFVDMGGNSGDDSDLLTSVIGRMPELLAKLNVKSEALHGAGFAETIGGAIQEIKSPEGE